MYYLARMRYDGSKFYGFQRQKNKLSVQKMIEDALSIIDKSAVEIKGAGRTDRCVHADDQCCSFYLNNSIPCNRLVNAINSIVNPYIEITEVSIVDENFHARFSVVEKEYIYKIYLGDYKPYLYDYVLHKDDVNINKLNEVANLFIGGHNFSNFVSGKRSNANSIIKDIKITQDNDYIFIIFCGKSFYRYMVRNLVGAMLMYNDGKTTLDEIKWMLEHPEIEKKLLTASPNGLYLTKIRY